jgi:hypothetical protein
LSYVTDRIEGPECTTRRPTSRPSPGRGSSSAGSNTVTPDNGPPVTSSLVPRGTSTNVHAWNIEGPCRDYVFP